MINKHGERLVSPLNTTIMEYRYFLSYDFYYIFVLEGCFEHQGEYITYIFVFNLLLDRDKRKGKKTALKCNWISNIFLGFIFYCSFGSTKKNRL